VTITNLVCFANLNPTTTMDNYEFKLITPNNVNNSARGKGKWKASLACLRNTNWNFDEVMDLISCKQK
jgi:hypothetical protein